MHRGQQTVPTRFEVSWDNIRLPELFSPFTSPRTSCSRSLVVMRMRESAIHDQTSVDEIQPSCATSFFTLIVLTMPWLFRALHQNVIAREWASISHLHRQNWHRTQIDVLCQSIVRTTGRLTYVLQVRRDSPFYCHANRDSGNSKILTISFSREKQLSPRRRNHHRPRTATWWPDDSTIGLWAVIKETRASEWYRVDSRT